MNYIYNDQLIFSDKLTCRPYSKVGIIIIIKGIYYKIVKIDKQDIYVGNINE